MSPHDEERLITKHEALFDAHSQQLQQLVDLNRKAIEISAESQKTAKQAVETANGIKTELVVLNNKLFQETLDSESLFGMVKRTAGRVEKVEGKIDDHLADHNKLSETKTKRFDAWTITLLGALAAAIMGWLSERLKIIP